MRSPERRARPRVGWAVRLYDRASRRVHGLDRPAAQVGPALCVEIRRSRKRHDLPDGIVIHRGDLIGILHLNNARIATVHLQGLPGNAVGVRFRRYLVASLRELAGLAAPTGPLVQVLAYSATTILHRMIVRFGFQIERDGVSLPRLSAACQRLLLASLHPRGALPFRREAYRRARRLWLTREALLARYGAASLGDSGRRSTDFEKASPKPTPTKATTT